ncbi:uncharacterized protein MEPE_06628 [Melanopsichium pennsylvanicum]|uniref:Uncharacterized protein n=1 Tax=Melanopsichium pennsylvanicum TaxID=63383 RepID=A0AAJ5C8E3_9BASI|nr:uncharacterized protein MEPE_06628 [Melanopsichium pennsylvanicum]
MTAIRNSLLVLSSAPLQVIQLYDTINDLQEDGCWRLGGGHVGATGFLHVAQEMWRYQMQLATAPPFIRPSLGVPSNPRLKMLTLQSGCGNAQSLVCLAQATLLRSVASSSEMSLAL